jgi:hypothetical protein
VRGRTALIVTLGLLAASVVVSRADAVDVYRRVVPTEVRTGVVSVRIALEPILEVPVRCEDGSMTCTESRRFSRVYGLEFLVERRESHEEGVYIETEDRGRLFLAHDFEAEDERAFAEELQEFLNGLAANAFDEPFANLRREPGPLESVPERSVEPAWSCFEDGSSRSATRYHRQIEKNAEGETVGTSLGTSTYGNAAITGPVCEESARAVETVYPEEYRTMPVPRVVHEQVVRVEFVDGLVEESYPDQLMPLPDGSSLTVAAAPGVVSAESFHRPDGESFSRATMVRDNIEYAAAAEAARLPTGFASDNGWLSRWTVETIERRLGPMPVETVLDNRALAVSLLPTAPPVPLGRDGRPRVLETRTTHPVSFDSDAFLEEIGRRLDLGASLDAERIEEVITLRPAGFRSRGWILVACRSDGSAHYWLPPTRAHAPVLNSDLFCGEVEAQIPLH